MTDRGRSLRDAINAALDGLHARGRDLDDKVVRDHVRLWVRDYAERRGVLLEDHEIESELMAVLFTKEQRP